MAENHGVDTEIRSNPGEGFRLLERWVELSEAPVHEPNEQADLADDTRAYLCDPDPEDEPAAPEPTKPTVDVGHAVLVLGITLFSVVLSAGPLGFLCSVTVEVFRYGWGLVP